MSDLLQSAFSPIVALLPFLIPGIFCYFIAKKKNLPWYYCFFGFFIIFGVIFVALIPARDVKSSLHDQSLRR